MLRLKWRVCYQIEKRKKENKKNNNPLIFDDLHPQDI